MATDWAAIEAEYVTGNFSQRELCKKYGISNSIMGKRATAESWYKKRQEYRKKAVEKVIQKAANADADRLYKLREATMKATDLALARLDLAATEELMALDPRGLKDIVGSIKDLAALMRDFFNLPTPAQKEAQRIAAERLELERKRLDAEQNRDNSIEVILPPEVKEWAE